ncbi:MAG: hypothetical protein J6Q85_01100 [Clostridia bacterium]|nr:hypothetical protein [Clostridia bacterium]
MRGRKNISDTVDMMVVALCADYERRRAAISERSVTHRTEMEYRYLNFKLFSAAEEIVGKARAELMIREIGNRVGYAYSELYDISEVSYKKKKQDVKSNIAKRLHLID